MTTYKMNRDLRNAQRKRAARITHDHCWHNGPWYLACVGFTLAAIGLTVLCLGGCAMTPHLHADGKNGDYRFTGTLEGSF